MKEGDIVVCIDNRVTGNYSASRFVVGLTINKCYTIVNFNNGYITIIDDFNDNFHFLTENRFITLEEFRDQKLKELGIL